MKTNEFIFPRRLSRRDFMKLAGVASAGLALPGLGRAEDKSAASASASAAAPVRIGSGYHTYEAVPGWGELPAGMKYGFGCGVIVDSKDRVYVTTRSESPC